MKKFLIAISCIILASLTVFSMACGKNKFKYTDMTDWGAIKTETLGGFSFETENYVYFINGEGKSTEDNKFGAPVKGALLAVDKKDLGKENAEYSVIVPKLFTATDKFSGLFVSGEGENAYVYYGTPCTDKDSSGKAASGHMTFMRTSLDGKKTDVYGTVNSLDYEYRFVEKDGVVYIVYYDFANSQIVSYNTADKTETIVAKTDELTTTSFDIDGDTYYPSLGAYKFAQDGKGISVMYTVTLYSENYYETKAEKEGYTRKSAKFNLLVSYTVGDGKVVEGLDFYGKAVVSPADAKAENITYAIEQIQKGAEEDFVFITKTDINAKATSYGFAKSKIDEEWEKIYDVSKVAVSSILVDLSEIYTVDTENQTIYRTTLIEEEKFSNEYKIATESEANQLLFIDDGFIYYYTSGNNIACYKIPTTDGKSEKQEIKVSEDIVGTSWYAPELVKVDGKTFILYLDNSSSGASYIKCLDVTDKGDENVGVDDNEDGIIEDYAFSGHVFMAIRLDEDRANDAVIAINKIETGEIVLTENENGELVSETLDNAISTYEGLTKEQKKFVEEDVLVKIEEAKQVVKLANLYNKLKGVEKYSEMSDEDKAEFKASIESAYKDAKAFRKKLQKSKKFDYITTRDRVNNNLKYYYQEADKIFTAE